MAAESARAASSTTVGAGPSKPADLRQAKPFLAASDDELEEKPTALLPKEFERLWIQHREDAVRRQGQPLPHSPAEATAACGGESAAATL
jgi:hypothetical protein